jgi:hypothetical protein
MRKVYLVGNLEGQENVGHVPSDATQENNLFEDKCLGPETRRLRRRQPQQQLGANAKKQPRARLQWTAAPWRCAWRRDSF